MDLTIEQCIQAGNDQSLVYVGLQNGDECWGDMSLGSYGKANLKECHIPCSREHNRFCGGIMRNSIYDLRDIYRGN